MVAGQPRRTVVVPASVQAVAGSELVRAVWENELGGFTFVLGDPPGRYVKWSPATSPVDLGAEAARLDWAARFINVPNVLSFDENEDGSTLVTAALAGENAVTDRWRAHPGPAVAAIGRGLRHLHDALPVEECPFTWTVEQRLAYINTRAAGRGFDPECWSPDYSTMSLADVLALLNDPPAVDRLVVCHGDACAPNTLLSDSGDFVGHVDLGSLGIGDRWADLAVATWSTVWNYGPGWEDLLLAAYDVDPDPGLTRYYRLLWTLGP